MVAQPNRYSETKQRGAERAVVQKHSLLVYSGFYCEGYFYAIDGSWLSALLAVGASSPQAADPSAYKVFDTKAGMTVGRIDAAFREQNLGSLKVVRAPSFDYTRSQGTADASAYEAVQTIRAENDAVPVEIFFVPMKDGPVAAKITTEIFQRCK